MDSLRRLSTAESQQISQQESALCAVEYRDFDLFSESVAEQDVCMEFRLVYQGPLHSTGNKSASGKVHPIRRYLHRQLVNLWPKVPTLNAPEDRAAKLVANAHGLTPINREVLSKIYTLGTKSYLPLVCDEHGLTCSLDILLLRKGTERTVVASGDIDGRIKTLIDALRAPVIGESANEGDENPLYCLMSNDQLISEVHVTADFLLAEPDQIVESPRVDHSGEPTVANNHVLAVINVKTRGRMNPWA